MLRFRQTIQLNMYKPQTRAANAAQLAAFNELGASPSSVCDQDNVGGVVHATGWGRNRAIQAPIHAIPCTAMGHYAFAYAGLSSALVGSWSIFLTYPSTIGVCAIGNRV